MSVQCDDLMLTMEIIGNLTRDPELKSVQRADGTRLVCNFTVAANRYGQEKAEFVRVAVWGKSAENCKKYLAKGRKVFARGEPGVHVWTGNDGALRGELELRADTVEFLSPKGEAEQQEAFRQETGLPASDVNGYVEVTDEELPF